MLELSDKSEGKLPAPRAFTRLRGFTVRYRSARRLPHEMLTEQETTPIIFLQS